MAPVFTANWFNFGRNPSAGGPGQSPVNATGGTEFTIGDYSYHLF